MNKKGMFFAIIGPGSLEFSEDILVEVVLVKEFVESLIIFSIKN